MIIICFNQSIFRLKEGNAFFPISYLYHFASCKSCNDKMAFAEFASRLHNRQGRKQLIVCQI